MQLFFVAVSSLRRDPSSDVYAAPFSARFQSKISFFESIYTLWSAFPWQTHFTGKAKSFHVNVKSKLDKL